MAVSHRLQRAEVQDPAAHQSSEMQQSHWVGFVLLRAESAEWSPVEPGGNPINYFENEVGVDCSRIWVVLSVFVDQGGYAVMCWFFLTLLCSFDECCVVGI